MWGLSQNTGKSFKRNEKLFKSRPLIRDEIPG